MTRALVLLLVLAAASAAPAATSACDPAACAAVARAEACVAASATLAAARCSAESVIDPMYSDYETTECLLKGGDEASRAAGRVAAALLP